MEKDLSDNEFITLVIAVVAIAISIITIVYTAISNNRTSRIAIKANLLSESSNALAKKANDLSHSANNIANDAFKIAEKDHKLNVGHPELECTCNLVISYSNKLFTAIILIRNISSLKIMIPGIEKPENFDIIKTSQLPHTLDYNNGLEYWLGLSESSMGQTLDYIESNNSDYKKRETDFEIECKRLIEDCRIFVQLSTEYGDNYSTLLFYESKKKRFKGLMLKEPKA